MGQEARHQVVVLGVILYFPLSHQVAVDLVRLRAVRAIRAVVVVVLDGQEAQEDLGQRDKVTQEQQALVQELLVVQAVVLVQSAITAVQVAREFGQTSLVRRFSVVVVVVALFIHLQDMPVAQEVVAQVVAQHPEPMAHPY